MIELAILGLLDDHELHGYELRKRIGELLGTRIAVSFGSLYPALNRLEKAGHVEAVTDVGLPGEAPRSPMSGSLTGELAAFSARRRHAAGGRVPGRGRGKKVYGVTAAGRQRLAALITDPDVSDDRTFAVRVAFCHHVGPDERIELFERQRAELTRRRDERRAAGTRNQPNRYLRSLLERDTRALYADIEWLDGLIATEKADAPADAPRDVRAGAGSTGAASRSTSSAPAGTGGTGSTGTGGPGRPGRSPGLFLTDSGVGPHPHPGGHP